MKKETIIPDAATTAVIKLKYPLKLADGKKDAVAMRRPTMGDLLDHEPRNNDDIEAEVKLIGILCALKIEEMRALDSTDYLRLQDQYLRFRAVPDEKTDPQFGDSPVATDALGAAEH